MYALQLTITIVYSLIITLLSLYMGILGSTVENLFTQFLKIVVQEYCYR